MEDKRTEYIVCEAEIPKENTFAFTLYRNAKNARTGDSDPHWERKNIRACTHGRVSMMEIEVVLDSGDTITFQLRNNGQNKQSSLDGDRHVRYMPTLDNKNMMGLCFTMYFVGGRSGPEDLKVYLRGHLKGIVKVVITYPNKTPVVLDPWAAALQTSNKLHSRPSVANVPDSQARRWIHLSSKHRAVDYRKSPRVVE